GEDGAASAARPVELGDDVAEDVREREEEEAAVGDDLEAGAGHVAEADALGGTDAGEEHHGDHGGEEDVEVRAAPVGVDGAGRAARPVREGGRGRLCRDGGRVHSCTGRDLSVTARARGGAPRSDAGGAVVVLAHEALELLLAAGPARGVAGEGPRIGVLPQLPAPPAPR